MAEKNVYFNGAKTMAFLPAGKICSGQDGAIYGGCLFRFNAKGFCRVFDLKKLEEIGEFTLDKAELIVPHSNAVCFSSAFFAPGDEFPILYTNIYNNYSSAADRLEGVCCAYRITRENGVFASRLVQVIRVGFVHDSRLWCSETIKDVRPYGNFAVDAAANKLHAFVMRDEANTTRLFRFALPEITAGVMDTTWGVPVVTLEEKDIEQQFDECYVNYMQGACCHAGIVYSVEGFDLPNDRARPAIHLFDTNAKKLVLEADLEQFGLTREPEFVEVYEGNVYYSDCTGSLFRITFAD